MQLASGQAASHAQNPDQAFGVAYAACSTCQGRRKHPHSVRHALLRFAMPPLLPHLPATRYPSCNETPAPCPSDPAPVGPAPYLPPKRLPRASNAVELDDLVALPLRLLAQDEELRATFQARYRQFLVDEFQVGMG